MSRSKPLEELFEAFISERGGPVGFAHVVCETEGFMLDAESGMPTGHSPKMFAIGIAQSGMLAVQLSEDEEVNRDTVDKTGVNIIATPNDDWLSVVHLDEEGLDRLIEGLTKVRNDAA